MPYTNTIVTTSTSGTWNGTSISYSTISLIDGIPHSAQLEVERIFTTPRDTTNYSTIEDFLNNAATTQKDKQQVFIIPASRITFNETSKTITAIDLPNSGATVYDFDPDGTGLANVPVPGIVSGTDTIKIRRKTVSNQTLVEWSAGSKLTSAQLNLEVKQLIYLIQELIDKTTTEVTVSNTSIGTIPNYSITPTKLSAGGPTWNSSSSLGIGIAPTSRMLTIASPNTSATIQIFNSSTGTGTSDGSLIQLSSNNLNITNLESGSLTLGTDNKSRLFIDSNGDTSIGSVYPAGNASRNLDIYNLSTGASAASAIRLITIDCNAGVNNSIGQLVKYQTGSLVLSNTDTNANANMRFFVGNSERLRIDSAGRVGIGAASAGVKLTVTTTGTGSDGIQVINSDNTAYGSLHAQGTTGGITSWANGFVIEGVPASTGNTILSSYTGALTFQTARLERMRIDSAGRVGIGTNNPDVKLHVVGGGGVIAKLQATNVTQSMGYIGTGDDIAYAGTLSNHPYGLITNNSQRMVITAGGDVGIGTGNPTTKLAVTGTTSISGITTLSSTEAATNTTSGALQVAGGVGIGGSVYAAEVRAPTIVATSVFNGNLYGNIGSTIVVLVPNLATALTSTVNSGYCSKPAASNVVTLPSGTWIGYAINMSSAGVVSTIANIPATSGSITCTGLTGANLVNLVLMKTA